MIVSYRNSDTENLANRKRVKRFEKIAKIALRKLRQLDIAADLHDLVIPPGNHLEALSGSRRGEHSIRINDQYRICFVWTDKGPKQVEITDYH